MKLFKSVELRIAKRSDGFTLVEVVVSIAMLATISIAFLQMFAVSGKTNKVAYELDTANSICIDATERYKDDPRDGSTDSGTYLKSPEFTVASGVYTKNFNGGLQLEITSTKTSVSSMPISYYPDAAKEAIVPDESDFNIELIKDAGDVKISINGGPTETISSNIIYSDQALVASRKAMIPIHLDCSGIEINEVSVNVTNNIGLIQFGTDYYEAIADIYLCDIKDGEDVSVKVVSGMATESRITKKNQTITKYSGIIRVKRVSNGSVLAENSAEEYWVGN